jgi:hypothetical protein
MLILYRADCKLEVKERIKKRGKVLKKEQKGFPPSPEGTDLLLCQAKKREKNKTKNQNQK